MGEEEEQEMALEHFKKAAAGGEVLSPSDVASWARKRGLSLTRRDLSDIRYRLLSTAYSSKFTPNKKHITMAFPRPGIIQVDQAFFGKAWKKENDGCGAFLLAVDSLSLFTVCVPMKDGTWPSWLDALTRMFQEKFNVVRYWVSDRDTAIYKLDKRKYLERKFGTKWMFLKNRCRSLGEREFLDNFSRSFDSL
jgi:hypothetical protein